MPILKVEYDRIQYAAILTAEDDDAFFGSILRACSDRSDQVIIRGTSSFSLPWWQFLGCREAVGYYVSRFEAELDFQPTAEHLLERAAKKASAFQEDIHTTIPVGELQLRLRRRGFTRELTEEQKRNVSELSGLPAGATFSVPGAGKTTEALALFFLRSQEQTRLLVVAPKNAFVAWEDELSFCAPRVGMQFVRLVGGANSIKSILTAEASPKLMLITYHQLQYARDDVAPYITANTWMFLDESHRIKRGMGGKIGNTILAISYSPDFKLLLSGTPMPNSDADLIPQFKFLFPEIEVSDQDVTSFIRPFYVRTTKKELGLRPPDRRLVPVPMTELQSKLYQLARSETVRQAELALRDRSRFRNLGRSVIRLLQLVSNPALVAKTADLPADIVSEILAEEDSPKLQIACVMARELAKSKRKVVIWSTFVDNVEILARRLADLGADYIHGGVDAGSDEEEDTREWKIKKFHQPDQNWVLIANPAACGEGISLHGICHHAIYVDRNYNAAQYLQSEDRIHRLGLGKDQATTIDILCCPKSIDESVNSRLIAKARRMADVLNDHDLHIDPVSFEPHAIDDDESMDDEDIRSLIQHLVDAEENE